VVDSTRLTSAVVSELIGMAKHELVFVSYATFPEQEVLSALREACGRDVDVTVVFERHVDNPTYAAIEDTKVPPTTSLDDLGAEPFLATHLFHPSRARPARGPAPSWVSRPFGAPG
jgi:phosphatidylserine/phosphatidylglycerophosphate/cardiolipin synthase-like enzyme